MQGALVVMGFKPLAEFTVCAWLKCDPSAGGVRTAISYATMHAVNTLVVFSDFSFLLYDKLHTLRNAPSCGAWRRFCLAYEKTGAYAASVDGKTYLQSRDYFLRGLPAGGVMIVGQYESRIGAAFEPTRRYAGDVHAVGVWATALGGQALDKTRVGKTRGALKEWKAFRAGSRGKVYVIEPSGAAAGNASRQAADTSQDAAPVLPWVGAVRFDHGP